MAEATFTCCQKLRASLTLGSFLPSTGWRLSFPRVRLRALGRGCAMSLFTLWVILVCSLDSDSIWGLVERHWPLRFLLQGQWGDLEPTLGWMDGWMDGRPCPQGGGWEDGPWAWKPHKWENEKRVWGMISEPRFYLSLKPVLYAYGFPRCDLVPWGQRRCLLWALHGCSSACC